MRSLTVPPLKPAPPQAAAATAGAAIAAAAPFCWLIASPASTPRAPDTGPAIGLRALEAPQRFESALELAWP